LTNARTRPEPEPEPESDPEPEPKPEDQRPAVEQPAVALKRDHSRSPDIAAVVAHYQTFHPQAKPGKKERAMIAARLQDGYSTADLCQAIDGYHRSPFHLGDNDRGKAYLTLALFFRDSTHVQAGIELASGESQPLAGAGATTRQNIAAGQAFMASFKKEQLHA